MKKLIAATFAGSLVLLSATAASAATFTVTDPLHPGCEYVITAHADTRETPPAYATADTECS